MDGESKKKLWINSQFDLSLNCKTEKEKSFLEGWEGAGCTICTLSQHYTIKSKSISNFDFLKYDEKVKLPQQPVLA